MAAPFTIDPEKALQRLGALRSGKSGFDALFEEIRKVTYPTSTEFTSTMVRGSKLHKDIFDGSGELSAEMLASALFGMATNPATKWMGLVPRNRDLLNDADVAAWMEHASSRMLTMFNSPRTNFSTQQFLKLQNFVSYGTAPQFIAELPGGVPLFQTAALAECYIAEGEDGRVNAVYRVYKRTAAQAYEKFQNLLPADAVAKALNPKRMDDEIEILHLVEPRPDAPQGRRDNLSKPIREAFIAIKEKHLIRESGFDEMPWVCPRMNPRPGESYGRGRGMTAHADTKMLQRNVKATIRGVEKRVDPPIQVPSDGVMSPLRMTPSGVNVVRAEFMQYAGGGIRAVETGADPSLGESFSESIRKRIDRAYWLPILEAFTDPKMTATQVLKLDEQTLRFIGPILGRMHSEDLGPMVERVFPIMLRGGQFLPPPPALEGESIEVEFVSPIAKAQRLEEARGLAETVELMAPIITAKPETLDNLDPDKAFRGVADLRGVPSAWLRSADAVAQIRDARAQQAQQSQAMQTATDGAPAAAKLISAVAQAANQNGAAA